MKKIKKAEFEVKDVEPFEHLEFVVKNTTAAQRLKWLESAWNFWYELEMRRASQKITTLKNE